MYKALALSLMVFVFTACGGGGSSPSDTITTTLTGRITVDGHVFNPDFYTDGQTSSVFISYFDSDGKLASYHELWEWKGSEPTYLDDYRYTYDSTGRLTSEENEFTYTREAPALYNHVFNQTTYSYDTNGNLESATLELTGADYNGDGNYADDTLGPTKITTYSYDTSSRLVTETVDAGADSQVNSSADTTTSYTYDAGGNIIEEAIDIGNYYTQTNLYEYDVANRKTKLTTYATEARLNADLKSSVTLYTYDPVTGLLTKEEVDNYAPGQAPSDTVDGFPDIVRTYRYGNKGELVEKSEESIFVTYSEKVTTEYLHEVRDADNNGIPEATLTYAAFLGKVIDSGGGYPAEVLPDWYTSAQTAQGQTTDTGWGLNWDGHDTGTCSTCGNMIGQVNSILLGF